ncbi:hypothetical protein FS749_009019 [Ceratobasidium sp. UAMH 11750]|nr:hypothetical protein FS749_009019 [Ceratobasidium sp. UAMH 11750]
MTLEGAESDAEALKQTLRRKGYLTHQVVNNDFDRSTALSKISEFLQRSYPGDVRIIVFTGHAYIRPTQPGRPAIVPPRCPDENSAISSEQWEQTVRKNAEPGVIVLSIFASCHAGAFMPQDHSLSQLDKELLFTQPPGSNLREPIFLTFASSAVGESSFESEVAGEFPCTAARKADHFLHALHLTASSPLVRNWGCFLSTLEQNFRRTREQRFSINGIAESPQTPRLTYSNLPVSAAPLHDFPLQI